MLELVPPDDSDLFHCEFCGKSGLDDMHSCDDIWLCDECHQGIIKEARECQHDWKIEPNQAGEIGVFCDRCGFWKRRASTPL